MAVVVVDKDNFLDQAQGRELKTERVDDKELTVQPRGAPKEAKAADPEPKTASTVTNESDLDDEDFAALTEKQQRTVNKKHRAMKEADEFAEEQYRERKAAERRAEEAERKLAEREAAGKPTPVEAKEPDPKDFTNEKGEFDAFGYAKALAKHAAEEAVKADRKEQDRLNREAVQARAYQEYLGRVEKSAKSIENWQELAESAADMNVSGALTQYLYESTDVPAVVLAHFAQHPDVLERLNALPAIKAIAEVTKLELSLTKEPAKADPEVKTTKSRAPEPIAPLSNGSAVVHKDPRDMTTRDHIEDEYRQAREAHHTRKRH
jgi:hypothetical protein